MEKELYQEVWVSRLLGWSSVMMSSLKTDAVTSAREALGVEASHVYFFKRLMYSFIVNAFSPFPWKVAGNSLQVVYPTPASWPITDSTLTRGQVLCPELLGVRSPGYCRGSLR